MKSYTVTGTILGTYHLMPHSIEDDPGNTIAGYVVFEDAPHHLIRALRLNKQQWTDDKNRPFTKTVVGWYSMEKPDGTQLFG